MEAVTVARPADSTVQSTRLPVIAVDLDGTLVRTDLLLECLLVLLKKAPYLLFCLPFWLLKGKAYLKQQIASRVSLDVSTLPYREDVLDYLREQRAEGRSLILATAADIRIARQVADHLNLFDMVLASDGVTNLSGEAKRKRMVSAFGEKGFDYAGNDGHDLRVWRSARNAIVVNAGGLVEAHVARVAPVERIFRDPPKGLVDYLTALRPHHWLKNLLVVAPLLAVHRFDEIELVGKAVLAFVSFGCFASAGYLTNDLLDLPPDRDHPRKRYRPFAAGDLPIWYALIMIPALVLLGCAIGTVVAPAFLALAFLYFGLSVTYSMYAKKIVLLDVIVLAGLYTLRIIAGSAAIGIWPSPWLLAFSTFLFFSLALVKRYSELAMNHVHARGYEVTDKELLSSMGIASGYVAILVLALYINTPKSHILYERPEVLWFLCPILLYWISHVWLSAHRGKMPDDPLVFATSDRTSRILILLMLASGVLAL